MFKITNVQTKKVENEDGKRLVGIARIVIENCFVINDIRIIQGKDNKSLFIAFPSRKQINGEFKDVCHPINSETREKIEEIILKEFKGEENDITNN